MSQKDVTWITDVLVPKILEHEELRGAVVTKTEVKGRESMKDNFASDMIEVNLLLQHLQRHKSLFLLLKVVNETESVRKYMLSDKQFFNEIHFYSSCMELFSSHLSADQKKQFVSLFPKCFYSYYNRGKTLETIEDAVIVMENLKPQGFALGDRTSLDRKHCILALKQLGSFHAFSYFVKEKDLNTFLDTAVQPIHETFYVQGNRNTYNIVFADSQQRVIDGLAKEVPSDDPGLARLRNLASRRAFDVFTEHIKPQEPLAVLCHGDFLRNNVLFRYANGEPVDMKLIDFQMVRYASPVIDVALFVCMNTSHALRAAHLHELLQVYHASLSETLAALSGRPAAQLDQRYSFDAFLDEFRKHAVYGYLVTVEFLPRMLASAEELIPIFELFYKERGSPRYNEYARQLGGERVTRVLVDLAKDLLDNKCL